MSIRVNFSSLSLCSTDGCFIKKEKPWKGTECMLLDGPIQMQKACVWCVYF